MYKMLNNKKNGIKFSKFPYKKIWVIRPFQIDNAFYKDIPKPSFFKP